MNNTSELRYCGRNFTTEELQTIRGIIAYDPQRTRAHISRLVCRALEWYKPDGGLKDMSCRVALLRLEQKGLIRLPARKQKPVCSQRIKRCDFKQPPGCTPGITFQTLANDG